MSADAFTTIETDVLVVGGGLAALRAALSARKAGARVTIAVKRKLGRSGSSANTSGGYAAAWDFLDALDSPELHYEDTIVGGGYVNDRAMVRALVDEAPLRLKELFEIGAEFRKREGRFHLSPSGDHRRPRVLVPINMRGTDMTLPLAEAVVSSGVEPLEDCVIVDLLTDDGRVVGGIGIGRTERKGWIIRAGATIIAAGGAGRLFPVTSNPVDVRGGGYALAMRAGARLRDMEFIQFYPWRLIVPFRNTRVPIQPSTFVAGGRLFNSRGERFMESYDPVKKEAAPRDISARAIFDQIRHGHDVEGGVRLDVSEIPDEQFRIDNTKVTEALDKKGINYRDVPLVVAPEAHFFMGGVLTDVDGRSDLPGLYAAGESAGGANGGNRLNSNAVPETQVFGHRAGVDAAISASRRRSSSMDPSVVDAWAERLRRAEKPAVQADESFDELVTEVQHTVILGIGIVRNASGLERTLDQLDGIRERLRALPCDSIGNLVAATELEDMCSVATACATSALERTESRAAHFREDYSTTDTRWLKTVLYDGRRCATQPIALGRDDPALRSITPISRSMPATRVDAKEFVE